MKKCPYCAEEILDEAIKCKHCGEFLNLPPSFPAHGGAGGAPVAGPPDAVPWYFRTPLIVVALLSVGPLALPAVWWHPKWKLPVKIIISVVVLIATWICLQLTILLYKQMMENYRILQEGGFL